MLTSDLANYQEISPNFEVPGCMVTGEMGDGVVFSSQYILDSTGQELFIGRQALTEGFALLSGITPAQLRKLEKVTAENKELKARIAEQQDKLAEFEAFKARMEEVGLIYRELE
jgi:hypothetical protein